MNIYAVIAFVIAILILSYAFGIIDPIRLMFSEILDIPELEAALGPDPIFKIAVRFAFLIVLYQIIKMILTRRE